MTPFETFLFYDSRRRSENACPADAMTILKVSGKLDYPRFRSAILDVSARHFVARHPVDLYEDGIIEWSKTEKSPEIHYFRGKATSETIPSATINILQEPGIRFWIYDEPEMECAEIWYHFHHVTTDALGSFLFLNEILSCYAGISLPETPVFTEKEIRTLADVRPTFRLSFCACRQVLAYFVDCLNPFHLRPLELRDPCADGSSQFPSLIREENQRKTPIMPALFHTFKRDFTRKLRDYARNEGVSMNNLLLSTAFCATARLETETLHPVTWNPFFWFRWQKSIQIAVPVSLRKAPLDGMSLRNIVSVMFLAEPVKWRKSRENFLHHIHRKMTYFRCHLRAEFLLLELKWLCALRLGRDRRWGMKRFLARKTPLATLVVSNLGILLKFSTLPRTKEGKIQAGTLCVEEIQLVSPRTTDAALTVAVGTYAERLHLGLHPDPRRLSDDATRRFLALWIEELETLVGQSFFSENFPENGI